MKINEAYQGVRLKYQIGRINWKIKGVSLNLCNHRGALYESGSISQEFEVVLDTREKKMRREINDLTNKRNELENKLALLTN